MPAFTEDEYNFIMAVREAVLSKPRGYVYDKDEVGDRQHLDCSYLNYRDGGTEGSCIIGRAMLALGMSIDELSDFEGSTARNVIPFNPNSDVAHFADRVQTRQDCGYSWMEAYMFGLGILETKGYPIFRLDIHSDDFD